MYIISETLGGNDPRLLPEMERLYSNWLYTSYYIPEESRGKVNLSSYDAEEVSESVAKAGKFGIARYESGKFKVGLRTGTSAHEDVFMESTEADGEKTYYFLTAEEDANTCEFLKTEMRIHLRKHFNSVLSKADNMRFQSKKNAIESEINACNDLLSAKKLLHNRFGLLIHNPGDHGLPPEAKLDMSEPGRDNY